MRLALSRSLGRLDASTKESARPGRPGNGHTMPFLMQGESHLVPTPLIQTASVSLQWTSRPPPRREMLQHLRATCIDLTHDGVGLQVTHSHQV